MPEFELRGRDPIAQKPFKVVVKATNEEEATSKVLAKSPDLLIESIAEHKTAKSEDVNHNADDERRRIRAQTKAEFISFRKRAIHEDPSLEKVSDAYIQQRFLEWYRGKHIGDPPEWDFVKATCTTQPADTSSSKSPTAPAKTSYRALRKLSQVYESFAGINATFCVAGIVLAFFVGSVELGLLCLVEGFLGTLFLVAISQGITLALDAQETLMQIAAAQLETVRLLKEQRGES